MDLLIEVVLRDSGSIALFRLEICKREIIAVSILVKHSVSHDTTLTYSTEHPLQTGFPQLPT